MMLVLPFSLLLPLIAAQFHLSYLQVSFLQTLMTGSASLLQIPASLLGERFGELLVLTIGNSWVGLGIAVMAQAPTYSLLLLASLLAGVGGNAQHPLAASLVACEYHTKRRARAISLLNMSGSLGKVFATLCVAAIALYVGWRTTLPCVALLTLLNALLSWRRRGRSASSREEVSLQRALKPDRVTWKATLLMGAGCLDEIAQKAPFTFLPFLFAPGSPAPRDPDGTGSLSNDCVFPADDLPGPACAFPLVLGRTTDPQCSRHHGWADHPHPFRDSNTPGDLPRTSHGLTPTACRDLPLSSDKLASPSGLSCLLFLITFHLRLFFEAPFLLSPSL